MSPRAAIGSCAAVGALLFVASLVLLGGCADSTSTCYEKPWAVDRTIGYFGSIASALDAEERIGCEVRP